MADPMCEISPDKDPISTCALKYTVKRSEDSIVSLDRETRKIGSAWLNAFGRGDHISIDDEMIRTYWSVAGESFMLQHPY